MEDSRPIIDEIVSYEWEMFSSVNNIGGRAGCQDQPDTFDIMRRCNLMTWPDNLLFSYRADLLLAMENGRNLMTEKYARMMEVTAPIEFEQIKRFLPLLETGVRELVDRAVMILESWEEEVRERYPFIATRGRGMNEGDGGLKTSFDTYLRSELETYSFETLSLYVAHLDSLVDKGENGSIPVYENMVRLYGYDGLEDANSRMA